MSGPGWLPSRPRPLGFARKRLVRYLPRRTSRKPAAERVAGVACEAAASVMASGLINRRARLPVARLLPANRRVGALHGWLVQRWLWTRPRLIPLVFAFLGCVGMLNARRYLLQLARGPAMVCAPSDAAEVMFATHAMIAAPHTPAAHLPHPERCVVDRWDR